MPLLRDVVRIVHLEARLFRRYPRLRLSVLGVVLIPALYAFIYLESVWDPASRTAALPAAIVNLDQGTEMGGQRIELGAELTQVLKARRAFGFYDAADAEQARHAVRAGQSLFALIIPPDFSASAMAASAPGAGRLVMYASEGNNYIGAGFARRFAAQLGHQLNETLNEKRWETVLGTADSSADRLQRLREGVARLREGAIALDTGLQSAHDGAARLAAGSRQMDGQVTLLADGMRQMGAGVRTLDARRPEPADLQALRDGASRLAVGHVELRTGLRQLDDGARVLGTGLSQMREAVEPIPLLGGQLADGTDKLTQGAQQLQTGLHASVEAQTQLTKGAKQLSKGVAGMTDGFAAYADGVATLVQRWPDDARLDALSSGSRKLSDAGHGLNGGLTQLRTGAAELASGLDTLAQTLPDGVARPPGTPRGLAATVAPVLEIDAPVRNNGMGFLPNFVPVALWLGAVMTAFLFHLGQLPEAARGSPRVALLLGKLGMLGAINIAQAMCVLLMSSWLLGLQPVHAAGLALSMVVSSLTFLLVIFVLQRSLGDAGKALVLMLLILQLSSAGGVMPIELANEFFGTISPWLPFTWSIKAVRASAFGAFEHEWGTALCVLALFALGSFLLAWRCVRWRFVPEHEHRPAIEA